MTHQDTAVAFMHQPACTDFMNDPVGTKGSCAVLGCKSV